LPKIIELDPHVADLIAAGEVVERPASVVKELMENSIDAGAGIVTVEIIAGGMTYIRVTDNGCGIAPDDAKTAFMRHATSKLRGAEGLEAIATLGFRGEALAAIAAVSQIDLLTRESGAGEGVSLTLKAGEVVDTSPAGCPEGTTIIVRDLFFNTPARQKFMKSDRTESGAVASAVLRCALARPDVSFRFIRDGKTECHTPGDSRVDSCIYSLFGREFSAGLIKAESTDPTLTVSGFISSPSAVRGNRSYQFFFVNGRPIRSKTLQAALEQAYANVIPSGRYPSCVLYIKTRLSDVDVNVHPAKTEVKFVSDKQVFDGIYYASLSALTQGSTQNEEMGNDSDKLLDDAVASRKPQSKASEGFRSMQVDEYRKPFDHGRQKADKTMYGIPSGTQLSSPGDARLQTPFPALFTPDSRSSSLRPQLAQSGFRVIGEVLKSYIIAEYQDGVWFIDKHAAHERIHFDALKSDGFTPMSQALITPIVCRHGSEDVSLLLENEKLLDKLGFTVEGFGEDSVAVRRIPSDIDFDDVEPVLSQICTQLRLGGTAEPARRDDIFRTIACKAAIKAGKSSGIHEMETLAARVLSGEVSHCPHGRPVAFELTKSALEKGFSRR